jgi:hypothetical protein
MLAISQKPERVSSILRSSVVTMRLNGMLRCLVLVPASDADVEGVSMVVMPLLLEAGCYWWCRAGSVR